MKNKPGRIVFKLSDAMQAVCQLYPGMEVSPPYREYRTQKGRGKRPLVFWTFQICVSENSMLGK